MYQLERINEFQEALTSAMEGHQATIWTALPGIIQSYDPTNKTVSVQPSIQALATAKDGSTSWVSLPVLLDCPVFFPRGGGYLMTFPIAQGDECLVVFASRCIDAWWQSGGVQTQAEFRMHDLSDGFVFPGFESVPRVVGNISTTDVEVRSLSGTEKISMGPSGILFKTPQKVTIDTGAGVDIKGNVNINGTVTSSGDGVFNGHSATNHVHTSASPGQPTGKPIG